MIRFVLPYLFFCIALFAEARTDFFVKKDLGSEWQVYRDQSYQPYDESSDEDIKVIYLAIMPHLFKHDFLQVEDNKKFSIFINGKLFVDQQTRVKISIDSLTALANQESVLITIYCSGIRDKTLSTLIITDVPQSSIQSQGPLLRQESGFKNFVIVSFLVLVIFFAIMLRLNPKHISHYFSLHRLFSLREGDDSQAYNKVASSANILFYVFLSLLSGFVLTILMNSLSSTYSILEADDQITFIQSSSRWLKISVLIFSLLLAKALIVTLFSFLFGISDQSGFQFLNFIRVLGVSFVVIAVPAIFYFILWGEGEDFHLGLYKMLVWIMFAWVILSFLKLMRRVHFSGFQLFSYICATEIIPFLFVVKLLYN
ncbi:MAG: DUF4271 domain-containing protein [Cyclobacteriaceae bacterium]|nr:DUF4271 domain-containing protein [Cyclobacteriaceae bacterium]